MQPIRPIRIKRQIKIGSRAKRIRIGQPDYRPFALAGRDALRRDMINEHVSDALVVHRRGIYRPKIGEDPLEARAVQNIKGTLPERIMLKNLISFRLMPDVDFDFQCLTSTTRVITRGLEWRVVGDLREGDRLLAFSEEPLDGYRRWKEAAVIYVEADREEVSRVVLSDGSSIEVTAEHPWLIKYPSQGEGTGGGSHWVQTTALKPGMIVPRFLNVWKRDDSWAGGWLTGMLDGEGSITQSKRPSGQTHALTVRIAQNEGETLTQLCSTMQTLGVSFSLYQSGRGDQQRAVSINGGCSAILEYLGRFPSQRLLGKLDIEKLGRLQALALPHVVRIESCGEKEIVRLATSTGTYIAEGFGMHNSSMEGGRSELGGMVADFILWQRKTVIRVQGAFHSGLQLAKDAEQKMALEEMGYWVVDITDQQVYDHQFLIEWTRRLLGYGKWGGGECDVETVQTAGWEEDNRILELLAQRIPRILAKIEALTP